MFAEQHLKEFRKRYALQGSSWLGHHVSDWATFVAQNCDLISSATLSALPQTRVSRTDLFSLAGDPKVSDLELTLCVLAWGGMNRSHGSKALTSWTKWGHIISKLRSANLTRSEAYELFAAERSDGHLAGMGPAYFTKLIYFCHPNHDGYIMDQWTARSVNLLGISPQIEMYNISGKAGAQSMGVSDKNSSDTYENFCSFVEALVAEVDEATSPSEIEEAMFSQGRGKGEWRNYVIFQASNTSDRPQYSKGDVIMTDESGCDLIWHIDRAKFSFDDPADYEEWKKTKAVFFELSPSAADDMGETVFADAFEVEGGFEITPDLGKVSISLEDDGPLISAWVKVSAELVEDLDEDTLSEWSSEEGGWASCSIYLGEFDAHITEDDGGDWRFPS